MPISAVAPNVDSMPLSVLIVDDEPIARHRVRQLLTRDPQIRIVGEPDGGETAAIDYLEAIPEK